MNHNRKIYQCIYVIVIYYWAEDYGKSIFVFLINYWNRILLLLRIIAQLVVVLIKYVHSYEIGNRPNSNITLGFLELRSFKPLLNRPQGCQGCQKNRAILKNFDYFMVKFAKCEMSFFFINVRFYYSRIEVKQYCSAFLVSVSLARKNLRELIFYRKRECQKSSADEWHSKQTPAKPNG